MNTLVATEPAAPHPHVIPETPLMLTAAEVRRRVDRLGRAKMIPRLAEVSGVRQSYLDKLRQGDILNPGIDTVAKFWPFLLAMEQSLDALDRMRAVHPVVPPGASASPP